MQTAFDHLAQYDFETLRERIYSCTEAQVLRAIEKSERDIDDFLALISPAAEDHLEVIASEAHRLTVERYGRTIQMYIPLYLSNICSNSCVYCGFNVHNKIRRHKLSLDEIDREAEAIYQMGFRHLLLVSGEDAHATSWQYYLSVVERLRKRFAQISLEVQPLETAAYKTLKQAGVGYVCIYQETYHREQYPLYHPAGSKADYRYRLETADRVAQAGIEKVGIGALLGLEDWRTDSAFTALHLAYLKSHYWQTRYSISLPRLRPAEGAYTPACPIDDIGMVQLITAFRLFDPSVDISLSTRESASFRDHVLPLGLTAMSAGSHTEPGGYTQRKLSDLEQFTIHDSRSPSEMAQALRAAGYDPIWKDWDSWLS